MLLYLSSFVRGAYLATALQRRNQAQGTAALYRGTRVRVREKRTGTRTNTYSGFTVAHVCNVDPTFKAGSLCRSSTPHCDIPIYLFIFFLEGA